jgi:acrylyl-CoA reductase (NADPH)
MFRALKATQAQDVPHAPVHVDLVELTDAELPEGDVTIDVEYSSLNYKDALALTGKPGVIRRYPLTPGIDLVGTVAASDDPRWSPGDTVIVNGWGIGETHDGGFSERTRIESDWLVPLPEGLDPQRAAAIGTAGFTAMLAVLALERSGLTPDAGDVLVTGAAGGLGSIAIAVLAKLGYRVVASTGREEQADYLRSLGAAEIVDRATLSEPGKPLQTQRFAAAVDSVGGSTLANVLAQVNYGGTVASCGLAQAAELPATVMPFILRAVTLTGINSVFAPTALRREAWSRLVTDLDPDLLDGLSTTIGLTDAVDHSKELLAGRVRGRTIVDVRG